jgi:hypothetical protein
LLKESESIGNEVSKMLGSFIQTLSEEIAARS